MNRTGTSREIQSELFLPTPATRGCSVLVLLPHEFTDSGRLSDPAATGLTWTLPHLLKINRS